MSRSFPLISKDKVGVIDASVDRAGRASPQAAARLDHPATIDLPMHTPGPWKIDRHLAMIVGPDGGPITGEANYLLATAAPDLLEALQRIVDSGVALTQAQRIDARDAIAKARGVS